MTKIDVQPIHPKEFKEIHNLSIYQLHRISKYPQETLKHWLAAPDSARYQEPKEFVKHHFGVLHKVMTA